MKSLKGNKIDNELAEILDKVGAEYVDVRVLRQEEKEIALRRESSDFYESKTKRFVCRAVSSGYGIASTNKFSSKNMKEISELAAKQAKTFGQKVRMAPIKPEQGSFRLPEEEKVEKERGLEFLKWLKKEVKDKLPSAGSEIVLSYSRTHSTLKTSEGTQVDEISPLTDLTVYIYSKKGYASKILGGRGGFEQVKEQPWKEILDKLVQRVKDSSSSEAKSLSNGRKYDVILGPEPAGGLAHEIAHLLEADQHKPMLFYLSLSEDEDFQLVDDPTLANGYGSFHWDDEGVKGKRKVLLSKEGTNLLHTRLTAEKEEEAGNAHGVTRKPRPTLSNVYIKPSDWRRKEMFEETRRGIYAEGIIRAESDTTSGRIVISPELAYKFENGEMREPIKNLKIVGNVRDILPRIDAIGKIPSLRPSLEKGFAISEGGPQIRISGIKCY